jgi:hypothetical protein
MLGIRRNSRHQDSTIANFEDTLYECNALIHHIGMAKIDVPTHHPMSNKDDTVLPAQKDLFLLCCAGP